MPQIRKRLGLSNAPIVIAVIAAVVVAAIITTVLVILSARSLDYTAWARRFPRLQIRA